MARTNPDNNRRSIKYHNPTLGLVPNDQLVIVVYNRISLCIDSTAIAEDS